MAPVDRNYRPHPIVFELSADADAAVFDTVEAAPFSEALLRERFYNHEWATRIGLGNFTAQERMAHFARFEPLPENLAQPLALRYHGHQFQNYNPNLGDGRGFLYAQLIDPISGRILDLGTKGSGKTPYSRGGDGRLTLKGAVREVLATEMLQSLGVETSKSFAVFETGESLVRHDEPSPTRGAVLTRLSHGHIRFGTFQRLAFLDQPSQVANLVQYCLDHYYPETAQEMGSLAADECTVLLLREVTLRSADLTAQWMLAGFVHGVLNSDNMNISGESFDYGPYRFLPTYQPNFTAAYFDHSSLYAYGRQPESVLWNLQQLASSLASVASASAKAPAASSAASTQMSKMTPAELNEALGQTIGLFAARFNSGVLKCFKSRLGLESQSDERSDALLLSAFDFLAKSQVGFEQFFHDWYGGAERLEGLKRRSNGASLEIYQGPEFELFFARLKAFRATDEAAGLWRRESLFQNPRPCSLLIDEIERIWDSIARQDDWSAFAQKVEAIRQMGRVYGRR